MKALQDFEIFVRTARLGSLTATAHQLDLTPAATSAAVKRLEAELGVALFLRSTRRLRLTLEGEIFLKHCQQALDLIEDAAEELSTGQSVIRGVLQLSAPSDLGRNVVFDWVDHFQALHPLLQIRLQLSDRIADIYSQPVDLALRYGDPPASNLVALPVAPDNYRVLCASPEYLQQHGTPHTPEDLKNHNCLRYMLSEVVYDRWRFYRQDKVVSVQIEGNRVTDDSDAVRRWALNGHGIAYKSLLDVILDLKAGRLVRLCPEWRGEASPLNMISADRRQISPAVRALHQYLVQCCQQLLVDCQQQQV